MANKKKEIRRTEEGFYICDRCGGYFEEHEMAHGRFCVMSVCKTCNSKARSESMSKHGKELELAKQELLELRQEVAELKRQLNEKNTNALARCTPRDLMRELHSRGYNGELEYIKVTKVDISKLED